MSESMRSVLSTLPIHRARLAGLFLLVLAADFSMIYTGQVRQNLSSERAGYAVVIIVIVVASGASGWLLLLTGRREDEARARRRESRPSEPWLWWREDWAEGFACDEKTRSLAENWLLANAAIAVSATILLGVGPAWDEETNPGRRRQAAVLAAAVTAASVAFTWSTAMRTRRVARQGPSVCRLEKVPIHPGEAFHATIELPLVAPPADGVVVTMQCHQVSLQSRTSELKRWRARGSPGRPAERIRPALHVEKIVIHSAVRDAAGIRVPVSFQLPPTIAVRTARYDPQSSLEWSLDVRARGVSARFTLPVFPNDVALVTADDV